MKKITKETKNKKKVSKKKGKKPQKAQNQKAQKPQKAQNQRAQNQNEKSSVNHNNHQNVNVIIHKQKLATKGGNQRDGAGNPPPPRLPPQGVSGGLGSVAVAPPTVINNMPPPQQRDYGNELLNVLKNLKDYNLPPANPLAPRTSAPAPAPVPAPVPAPAPSVASSRTPSRAPSGSSSKKSSRATVSIPDGFFNTPVMTPSAISLPSGLSGASTGSISSAFFSTPESLRSPSLSVSSGSSRNSGSVSSNVPSTTSPPNSVLSPWQFSPEASPLTTPKPSPPKTPKPSPPKTPKPSPPKTPPQPTTTDTPPSTTTRIRTDALKLKLWLLANIAYIPRTEKYRNEEDQKKRIREAKDLDMLVRVRDQTKRYMRERGIQAINPQDLSPADMEEIDRLHLSGMALNTQRGRGLFGTQQPQEQKDVIDELGFGDFARSVSEGTGRRTSRRLETLLEEVAETKEDDQPNTSSGSGSSGRELPTVRNSQRSTTRTSGTEPPEMGTVD